MLTDIIGGLGNESVRQCLRHLRPDLPKTSLIKWWKMEVFNKKTPCKSIITWSLKCPRLDSPSLRRQLLMADVCQKSVVKKERVGMCADFITFSYFLPCQANYRTVLPLQLVRIKHWLESVLGTYIFPYSCCIFCFYSDRNMLRGNLLLYLIILQLKMVYRQHQYCQLRRIKKGFFGWVLWMA